MQTLSKAGSARPIHCLYPNSSQPFPLRVIIALSSFVFAGLLSGAEATRELVLIDPASDRYQVSVTLVMEEPRFIPRLTETLPAGWELISGSMEPSGQILSDSQIRWQFVSLEPVAAVVSYEIRPVAPTANVAEISGVFTGVEPEEFTLESTPVDGPNTLYRLTTSISGSGSIQRNPAANWFQAGSSVALGAEPIPPATFSAWSGSVVSSDPEIVLTMNGPKDLNAHFEQAWLIELVSTQRGEVIIDPVRPAYADGETVTLRAEAAFGYKFVGWAADLADQTENPLTIEVDRNLSVIAHFIAQTWATAVHREITMGPANQTRVDLDVYPEIGSVVYAVQEEIPPGWQVTEVSPGGIVDTRNSLVKWGLFFDNQLRSFYYVLSPATPLPSEVVARGAVSIDGNSQTASGGERVFPSVGTSNTVVATSDAVLYSMEDGAQVTRRVTPGSGTQVFAYEESVPVGWTAVDISHSGHFDTRRSKVKWGLFFGSAPRDLSYRLIPADGALPVPVELQGRLALDGSLNSLTGSERLDPAPLTEGTAVANFAGAYRSGLGMPVTIQVTPLADQSVFAVEHLLPEGWTAVDISDGGHFDHRNNKVKWGLFLGEYPLSLSYLAVAPWGETRNVSFSGLASFDGASNAIFGSRATEHSEYSRWQQFHFRTDPNLALDTLDPDGDRVSNLMEFALGRNPRVPGGQDFVEYDFEDGWLIVSVQLARLDVAVNLQQSPNLSSWMSAEDAFVISDGQTDGFFSFALPLPENGEKFIRLGMSYAP